MSVHQISIPVSVSCLLVRVKAMLQPTDIYMNSFVLFLFGFFLFRCFRFVFFSSCFFCFCFFCWWFFVYINLYFTTVFTKSTLS